MTQLLTGGEPFLLGGGRIGCLLIHGFTGTPAEMRSLGSYLNHQGHTVLGIRLFGHATRPDDMLRARRNDWLADVESGLSLLRGVCDKVVAAGLSMGGLLALWAGAQQAVQAVICLSTPLAMPRARAMRFARPLSRLVPYVPKGEPDWRDPEAADGHVTYPAYPTRAAAELRDLIRDVRHLLPKVRVPLLIIQARGDRAVPADSMAIMLGRVGSVDKRTLWLEDSGHVITRDRERQAVFAAVSAFIAETMGLPA
jgi:carboxylesterase